MVHLTVDCRHISGKDAEYGDMNSICWIHFDSSSSCSCFDTQTDCPVNSVHTVSIKISNWNLQSNSERLHWQPFIRLVVGSTVGLIAGHLSRLTNDYWLMDQWSLFERCSMSIEWFNFLSSRDRESRSGQLFTSWCPSGCRCAGKFIHIRKFMRIQMNSIAR